MSNNAQSSRAFVLRDLAASPCEDLPMDRYKELAIAFVEDAVRATGLPPSTLAVKAGLAHTTLARVKTNDSLMSLRTAWTVSEFAGVLIPQVATAHPSIGERINDPDEAAWLGFWRRLQPIERALMFKTHRIDPPDYAEPRRQSA